MSRRLLFKVTDNLWENFAPRKKDLIKPVWSHFPGLISEIVIHNRVQDANPTYAMFDV